MCVCGGVRAHAHMCVQMYDQQVVGALLFSFVIIIIMYIVAFFPVKYNRIFW